MNHDPTTKIPPSTVSFIVKVWLEERPGERRKAVWRGHITRVPTGQRVYVQKLAQITDFIAACLVEMGVEPGFFSRLRRWWGSRAGRAADRSAANEKGVK
jgi:hypothetical protein